MFEPTEIHPGLWVLTGDGHHLGTVREVADGVIYVHQGHVHPHEFTVDLSDVREVAHHRVYLKHGRDSLFFPPHEIPLER